MGFESFAVDFEDLNGHAARAGFGVWLEEDRLVGIAGGDGLDYDLSVSRAYTKAYSELWNTSRE